MKPFNELKLEQRFLTLPTAFYRAVEPAGVSKPELVIASSDCCQLLGVNKESLVTTESLNILSANQRFNVPSIAMKYTGHQFGYYNPDLGDGRGLLLGNIKSPVDNKHYDLHIKGAGQTPFSRQGDGRAVLRSSIREFLASEAMHALGIPTSRALAVINSQTEVERETIESGATLLRVTPSHIRFGHFEFARHSGDIKLLTQLADYVIEHHYPCFKGNAKQYADLFNAIAIRTASLIAKWQAFGFAHGVMNTDNMSILGETFDFGPYGFLDQFNPSHICNHSDHSGRYAFDQQPNIAHWNLSVLAHAFSPLVEQSDLSEGIQAFNETFNRQYLELMRQKLGLFTTRENDQGLIFKVLNMMAEQKLDYSFFFRKLSSVDQNETYTELKGHCVDREKYEQVINDLLSRWQDEAIHVDERRSSMNKINPKYILRNHLAQRAIEAAQQGDYSEVNSLHKVLEKPYDEQPAHEHYAQLPPEWAESISISCSS